MQRVHVTPRNDTITHDTRAGSSCPCHPTVEDEHDGDTLVGQVVVHQAADGRTS